MAKKSIAGSVTNFEDAISKAGFGYFNLWIILVSGGTLMAVIIETMCMMFIVPAAQCDLELNLSEKSVLSSISFLGVVSGSYMWGYLADTRGRKKVLVVSLITSGILTITCSIVPWDWLFILLRFLNGFFIGAASSVIYAFAGEFHDVNHRPKIISFIAVFVAFGNMYLPGLAWVILPQTWSFHLDCIGLTFKPWRLLMIIYALPSLIFGISMHFLPESPKFLLTQERKQEALHILRRIYAMNHRKPETDYPVSDIIWDEVQEHDEKIGMWKLIWIQTKPLFHGELLVKTVMLCILQFGLFASTSGIAMWYPEVLNAMSHYMTAKSRNDVSVCKSLMYEEEHDIEQSAEESNYNHVCKDVVKTDVFLVSLVVGICYAFTYVIIGMIINLTGKKRLMVVFLSIITACGFATQFVVGYNLIQILIGVFILGGASIGIVNAIAVDLFPTKVRAMAFAVSLMFGRFGAMTGSSLVGPILYSMCDYLFYFVAADHIILLIIVVLLPTKAPFATKQLI